MTRPARPRALARWLRRDDGVSAVEAAILAPALIAMLVLAIVAMRTVIARQTVTNAAHDAARAASIEQDGTVAQSVAGQLIQKRLGGICKTLQYNVDVSQFANPIGTPANVTVTITCVADLSDVAMPGMPGHTTYTTSFVSPIDQYRGRSS